MTPAETPSNPVSALGLRPLLSELLQWQLRHQHATPPALDAAAIAAELAGLAWAEAQEPGWIRCQTVLTQELLVQPGFVLHEGLSPRHSVSDDAPRRRGPLGLDLAALLRDPDCVFDEAEELDLAIRYWEAARRSLAGIPEDFGEFWRQFEWAGLAYHLGRLGRSRVNDPTRPRLLAHAVRVSTRYNGLGPLTRLLEPLQQGLVTQGFSLR